MDSLLTLLLHLLADGSGLRGLVGIDLVGGECAVNVAPSALLLCQDAGIEWISAEGGVRRV